MPDLPDLGSARFGNYFDKEERETFVAIRGNDAPKATKGEST
jgi:hypothetical protein